MTAMEIFEKCKAAEGDKKKLRDKIQRYRDSAGRMNAALDGIGARSTDEPDKLLAIMAEISELEGSIRQRDEEYAVEVAAACRLLDMLPDTECKIINAFYLQDHTLTLIARELNYSYGYTRTLKSIACTHLEAIPESMVTALLPAWYREKQT